MKDAYVSKWSVLTARLEEAKRVADQLQKQLDGLDATPCGLTCTGCKTLLVTEGDFARHFSIPDTRYLNLGNCPWKDAKPEQETTLEIAASARNKFNNEACPEGNDECSPGDPCSDSCHQRYTVQSQFKSKES